MANSNTISRRTVTARTKRVIANAKGKPVSEILLHANLRGKLRFTNAGVRALSVLLNKEFGTVGVTTIPDECEACVTVRDVRNLVWRKVPADQKDG